MVPTPRLQSDDSALLPPEVMAKKQAELDAHEYDFKPCSNPAQTLLKPCSNPAQTLLKLCSNPAQTLLKPCSNPAQTLLKPCSNPAQTLLKSRFSL
jgi:hypothetical protein